MFKKLLLANCLCLTLSAWTLRCSDPVNLSDTQDEIEKNAPRITINERGDAAVIWQASKYEKEFQNQLQISVRNRDHHWSPAQSVSSWTESFINNHQVCINSSGKIMMAWEQEEDFISLKISTHYAEKDPAGNWSFTSPILFNQRGFNDWDTLLSLTGGVWTLLISSPYSSHGNTIQATHLFNPNLVKNDISYSTLATNAFSPILFMNEKDQAIAVWRTKTPLDRSLECSWYYNGEWTPIQSLGTVLRDHKFERVYASLNENEEALVTWVIRQKINENDIYRLQARNYSHQQWSPIIDISNVEEEAPYFHCLLNQQGDSFIAWDAEIKDKSVIRAAYKPKNQEWICSIPPLFAEGYNFGATVKSTETGDFIVVWHNDRNQEGSRYAITTIYGAIFSTKTLTWSDPVKLSPPGKSCIDADFILTGKGQGLISWVAFLGPDETNECVQIAELSYDE